MKSMFCTECDRRMLYVSGVNHVLHLLLSVFTCGVWLPVWLLVSMLSKRRCARCGKEAV